MKVETAYANLEEIITCGFLSRGIRYKDSVLILKTITDKEYHLLPFYAADEGITAVLYRLVFSTFMINGYNFLVNRNEIIPNLIDFYEGFSVVGFHSLVQQCNKVYEEYLESLEFLEGFCYTDKSRALWKILSKNKAINVNNYYGIPGTENLGLNTAQESWIIINDQLDAEESYNVQFRLSLMIASSFSGKGAQKIENSYEAHRKELEEVRMDLAKYGYDKKRILKEKEKIKGWSALPKTREDMVRELNREMSGDRDKHDNFIENWIKRQEEQALAVKQEAEMKQKAFRQKLEQDIDFTKFEDSRVATPEEVERLMKKKEKPGRAKASDPLEKKYSTEDVLKKIGSKIIQ